MKVLSAGPTALLVEVGDQDAVFSFMTEVQKRRSDGWRPDLIDVVPGANTVLFDGVKDVASFEAEMTHWIFSPYRQVESELIELSCSYRGVDLDVVAKYWRVTAREVVDIHSAIVHRVAFCGFTPGFAYMSGLPANLHVPRRESPRPNVPPGSVALADTYTGIYPRSTPGGWQIIGTCVAELWDILRDPPALLVPGMTVRFLEA